MTQIIDSLSDISAQYDAVFCDLWGCLHNGVRAHTAAVDALRNFKAKGGTVILLTNAPRQRASVEQQLERFQTPRDCWDSIATSGDSARVALFQGAIGDKVYFIGQPHDEVFFEPIKVVTDPVPIQRTALEDATGILCTGPFDPYADPATLRPTFLSAIARNLPMLCANPDLIVDRGDKREWCAGTLAQLYRDMGGETFMFGKPHPPIYDLARRRIIELGGDVDFDRILCIGDGIGTDILGAQGEALDSLFITGGLAAEETKTVQQPDPQALERFLETAPATPTYAMGQLR